MLIHNLQITVSPILIFRTWSVSFIFNTLPYMNSNLSPGCSVRKWRSKLNRPWHFCCDYHLLRSCGSGWIRLMGAVACCLFWAIFNSTVWLELQFSHMMNSLDSGTSSWWKYSVKTLKCMSQPASIWTKCLLVHLVFQHFSLGIQMQAGLM